MCTAGNVQGSWTPVNPNVFIGVAEYDRHPDYQYFIQRAETALAEASMAKRPQDFGRLKPAHPHTAI